MVEKNKTTNRYSTNRAKATFRYNKLIKQIPVSDEFYNKIRGDCESDEWYTNLNT